MKANVTSTRQPLSLPQTESRNKQPSDFLLFSALVFFGLLFYLPYVSQPIFSTDSTPFPVSDAMVSEGRWGVFLVYTALGKLLSPAAYNILFLCAAAAGAVIASRVFGPPALTEAVLQRFVAGTLIVANPGWIMMTPWPLHLLSLGIAFVLMLAAFWVVLVKKGLWLAVALALTTFSIGIYQQNVAIAAALWILYVVPRAIKRSRDWSALTRPALLWVAVVAISCGAYFVILRWVFAASVEIAAWRQQAAHAEGVWARFVDRIYLLDGSKVTVALGDQWFIICVVWAATAAAVVFFARSSRWKTAAVTAILTASGYLIAHGLSLVLGTATYERMLFPFFFLALSPLFVFALDRPAQKRVGICVAVLVALLFFRAGAYHELGWRWNQNAIAVVRDIGSRIRSVSAPVAAPPVILVGNRETCGQEFPTYVFCNYWRGYLFRSVLDRKDITDFSAATDGAAAIELTRTMPSYPEQGSVVLSAGRVFVKLGPLSSWN